MYADADGYYEIHPNGKDGDAVTVYCDLTLGADYYICDDCNDFWRYNPTKWASTNALSYSFDWHPSVGYCEGGDWRELAVGSLEECWEVCAPSAAGSSYSGGNYYTYDSGGDNFATACVNWMPEEERCSCTGEWSDDDSEIDASDYCVRSDDPRWGVAVPRGTEFSRDCENDGDSYEHDCPSGMEPIIPRSREHWVRSVVPLFPR